MHTRPVFLATGGRSIFKKPAKGHQGGYSSIGSSRSRDSGASSGWSKCKKSSTRTFERGGATGTAPSPSSKLRPDVSVTAASPPRTPPDDGRVLPRPKTVRPATWAGAAPDRGVDRKRLREIVKAEEIGRPYRVRGGAPERRPVGAVADKTRDARRDT